MSFSSKRNQDCLEKLLIMTEQGNLKDDPRAYFSAREEESIQKDPQ